MDTSHIEDKVEQFRLLAQELDRIALSCARAADTQWSSLAAESFREQLDARASRIAHASLSCADLMRAYSDLMNAVAVLPGPEDWGIPDPVGVKLL